MPLQTLWLFNCSEQWASCCRRDLLLSDTY